MNIKFIIKFFSVLFFLIPFRVSHAGIISDAPRVSSLLLNILNFLLSIGGVLAIIMLTLSGGMYMFAAGDRRMIAKAKKATKYSVVGIIVTLSGMIIVKFLGSIIG